MCLCEMFSLYLQESHSWIHSSSLTPNRTMKVTLWNPSCTRVSGFETRSYLYDSNICSIHLRLRQGSLVLVILFVAPILAREQTSTMAADCSEFLGSPSGVYPIFPAGDRSEVMVCLWFPVIHHSHVTESSHHLTFNSLCKKCDFSVLHCVVLRLCVTWTLIKEVGLWVSPMRLRQNQPNNEKPNQRSHIVLQVISCRMDGTVNFYRSWNHYKVGFGAPHSEHWIGESLSLFTPLYKSKY